MKIWNTTLKIFAKHLIALENYFTIIDLSLLAKNVYRLQREAVISAVQSSQLWNSYTSQSRDGGKISLID